MCRYRCIWISNDVRLQIRPKGTDICHGISRAMSKINKKFHTRLPAFFDTLCFASFFVKINWKKSCACCLIPVLNKGIALSKSTSYIARSSKQLQQLAQQLDMNTVIRQEIGQNFIR